MSSEGLGLRGGEAGAAGFGAGLGASATGSGWHAYRLSVVRGFAAHLHALDPAHELVAQELLAQRPVGLEGPGDVERVGQLLDHRPPQFGLAGEVGVDRPLGEPGVPGDRLE